MAITSVNSRTAVTSAAPGENYTGAMVMVTTLFFVWGFLTSLNDILIPHLKSIFDLDFFQSMLVQFAFFGAYFLFALPSGRLIEKIGYKRTMVAGLLVAALGAILFIPSANVPSYPLFLTAYVVLAAGITVLQVSANPYVSVLGPPQTASSRLNLTQAFNSLGTTIGPPLGGMLILSAAAKTPDQLRQMNASQLVAYRLAEAASVKTPYLVITAALVLLGLAIAFTRLPSITATRDFRPGKDEALAGHSILRYRHLVLGAIGIFVYVGAVVSIGSFLISYMETPALGGIHRQTASLLVAIYWGGAMIGRFIGAALLQKLNPARMLGIHACAAGLLVATSMLTTGHVALASILLVGLCNSIMFPTIFTLGIAELGPLTGKGSGLMVMAIVGGAILPILQGYLADKMGIQHAFFLPVLCYLFIAYYGFAGSRPRLIEKHAAA
jgi:FHS family L-fucose permease-like MFS transporter